MMQILYVVVVVVVVIVVVAVIQIFKPSRVFIVTRQNVLNKTPGVH
jgi:hypothetical protein